jgi:O-antigen/teichoic acid export membrane protein
MTSRAITIKDTYAFFLPLIFMAELMMISHSVIHAFLARMEDPKQTLAAYSIAFYFHTVVGSPVWTSQFVCISYMRDKIMVRRLMLFYLQVTAMVAWLWILVGATPFGHWFFMRAFGASARVASEAQTALLLLVGISIPVIVRSLGYALFMVNRRTILVTAGTAVRLASLAGLLVVLPFMLRGAAIGGAALMGCITVEAIFVWSIARHYYHQLPAVSGPPASYGELWRFSWPIMLVNAAESGVGFTINFFLGRLLRPELAVASFGVLDGLMRLLLSPLRALTQTSQTLTKTRGDLRVMLRFLLQLLAIFSTVMLLFFLPPVRALVLEDIIGLPEEMSTYVAPAMLLAFLLAIVMGSSAMFRGLVIGSKRTGSIATSAAARLLAIIAVGAVGMLLADANGAVIGMCALIGAFGAEALVLGWRLFRMDSGARRLFQEEEAGAPAAEAAAEGKAT